MEDLIELVCLFQRTKFKANGLMNLVLEPGSQMERLYKGIGEGTLTTDIELLAHFPELNGSIARAATLKSKLKDRLLDAVLLLDWKETAYTDRQKAFSECTRKWTSAMVLMSKNNRKNAINLLENLLSSTRRFEFTEISINILQTLSMHYALIEGDSQKHEQMESEITNVIAWWNMERQAEKWYMDLVNKFVRQKASKEMLAQQALKYSIEVKSYMETCSTYKLQLFGRLIEIVYCDSIGDYSTIVQLSKTSLDFFNQKDYISLTALQAFHYHLFVAHLNLRQYETCETLIDEYNELFLPGSYNWFKLYEVLFLTAMHTEHFSQSRDICRKIIPHPNFETLPAPVIELWKIFDAYIAFLESIDLLNTEPGTPKFRLGKFLNEVEIFNHDKAGMNVPILIVQFLHYLAQEDFDSCAARVETLAKYRLRHLKDDASSRNQAFIRLLEQIPKASFYAEEIERRSVHIYQVLCEQSQRSVHQNHEIEIIPYEQLWAIILRCLPRRTKTIYSNKELAY